MMNLFKTILLMYRVVICYHLKNIINDKSWFVSYAVYGNSKINQH